MKFAIKNLTIMKSISKLSKMLKIKSFIWIFILLFLVGLSVILYYYKYTGIEGFNPNAPVVQRHLRTASPILWGKFYGGRDWFHLNSLLFFDETGKMLVYGRDYYVYSDDGFGKWGAKDYAILNNNNPNQIDTFYHSSSQNCTFYIVFTRPQTWPNANKRDIYLSRIYIRNRLNANNSGDGFSESSLEIKYRIQNYKLMVYSLEQNNNKYFWKEAMFEHKLGEDGNLMKRPNFDIIFNFKPYRDLAAETAKAKATAETEEKRRNAEELRQTNIAKYLTNAAAYEQSAKLSNESSNRFLQQLQKYTNDTRFMTEPIRLDIDTSDDIMRDSIIQKSNNDMTSNVETSRMIVKNITNNIDAIENNLNNAIILLKQIAVAYTNIVSQEISLPDIERQLSALTASSEQTAKFAATRTNIETYKKNANNNITSANISIDEVKSSIEKIVSSEDIANANLKTVERVDKIKKNIIEMTTINERDNEESAKIIQEITKSTNSVFGSGFAPSLIV